MDIQELDDLFYPLYLEYGHCRDNFYEHHHKDVAKVFKKISNGGRYWFRYTRAKNGDYCFSVSVVYNNRLILNHVGYKDKNVALMSIVDALRKNDFARF